MQIWNKGKRQGRATIAAASPGKLTNYLFNYTDKESGTTFLIDTWATESVFPVTYAEISSRQQVNDVLVAANGMPIPCYGWKLVYLTVGNTALRWPFLLAKVTRPILGADFLCHSGLLVDVRNKRLVKADTWDIATARANKRHLGDGDSLHRAEVWVWGVA